MGGDQTTGRPALSTRTRLALGVLRGAIVVGYALAGYLTGRHGVTVGELRFMFVGAVFALTIVVSAGWVAGGSWRE